MQPVPGGQKKPKNYLNATNGSGSIGFDSFDVDVPQIRTVVKASCPSICFSGMLAVLKDFGQSRLYPLVKSLANFLRVKPDHGTGCD